MAAFEIDHLSTGLILGILGETMPSIDRISRSGYEPIVDVGAVEAIEGAIRAGKPGRFHIDEISSGPLPSGHTGHRWGIATRDADGGVALDPDPWIEP